MFRTLRPFSSFSRRLSYSHRSLLKHDGPVIVQRVRFSRPIFTAKRLQSVFINASLFAVFCYYMITDEVEDKSLPRHKGSKREDEQITAIDGQELAEDEGEDKAEDEDEVQVPDIMPEDARFIPLGFARPRAQTFYKRSDPEWQSFAEFLHDRKRNVSLRDELAGLVCHNIANRKDYQKTLGPPIKMQAYWLDIDYPDGPPPEYERSGLEITSDYVAWTTRPISPIQYSRLRTALWPIPLASSFWASYTTILSLQVARAKQFLGIESGPEKQSSQAPAGFVDFQKLVKSTNKQESHSGAGIEKTSGSETKSPEIMSTKSSSKAASSDSVGMLPPLPSIPQPGGDMSSALMAFKRTLAKTWHPPPPPPERGTFMVSGLIKLGGSKAVCVLEVGAAYHPGDSRWVFVAIGKRRVQRRVLYPKGGE